MGLRHWRGTRLVGAWCTSELASCENFSFRSWFVPSRFQFYAALESVLALVFINSFWVGLWDLLNNTVFPVDRGRDMYGLVRIVADKCSVCPHAMPETRSGCHSPQSFRSPPTDRGGSDSSLLHERAVRASASCSSDAKDSIRETRQGPARAEYSGVQRCKGNAGGLWEDWSDEAGEHVQTTHGPTVRGGDRALTSRLCHNLRALRKAALPPLLSACR